MKKTSRKEKTIVWAIDAFAEKKLQTKGLKTLKTISEAFGLEVDPVYVLSSGQVQVQNELYPNWAVDYEGISAVQLKRITQLAELKITKKPTILIAKTDSLQGATARLINYGKKINAKFIFANTHSNEGLSRFFLGSFTETLLLQNKIPVLVTNPTTETPAKIRHILFPTDFLHESRKGLEDAVELALKLNAKLTLYHKKIIPLYLSFPDAPFYNVYIEDLSKQLIKNSKNWLLWAKSRGAKCNLVMDRSIDTEALGRNIIKFAEKNKIDLICSVTKSSAMGAALLGSTARYLVRHAHCPVWVHHS